MCRPGLATQRCPSLPGVQKIERHRTSVTVTKPGNRPQSCSLCVTTVRQLVVDCRSTLSRSPTCRVEVYGGSLDTRAERQRQYAVRLDGQPCCCSCSCVQVVQLGGDLVPGYCWSDGLLCALKEGYSRTKRPCDTTAETKFPRLPCGSSKSVDAGTI